MRGRVDGIHDELHVRLQSGPLGMAKDYDRDTSLGQILLIAKVLVSDNQHFIAFVLRCAKKIAVL